LVATSGLAFAAHHLISPPPYQCVRIRIIIHGDEKQSGDFNAQFVSIKMRQEDARVP
jgi:hypothetical protein